MLKARSALIAAVLAVVLWVVGLVISSASDNLASKATDEETLAWVKSNANTILLSAWVFAVGCLAFMWFLGIVRGRLAEAEGGTQTLSAVMFGAGIAASAFAMATTGDVPSAISKNDITPATAGALHQIGDLFFVVAELAMVVVMVSFAVLVLRTAILPRWWAYLSLLVGVVLVIGPIGWAGLIFGTPIWALVTGFLLDRKAGAPAVAPAAA